MIVIFYKMEYNGGLHFLLEVFNSALVDYMDTFTRDMSYGTMVVVVNQVQGFGMKLISRDSRCS